MAKRRVLLMNGIAKQSDKRIARSILNMNEVNNEKTKNKKGSVASVARGCVCTFYVNVLKKSVAIYKGFSGPFVELARHEVPTPASHLAKRRPRLGPFLSKRRRAAEVDWSQKSGT